MSVFRPDTLAALPALSRAKIYRLEEKRRAAFMAAREAEDRLNDGKDVTGKKLAALVTERAGAIKACGADERAISRVHADYATKNDLANEHLKHLGDALKRAENALAEFAYLEKANTWLIRMIAMGEKLSLHQADLNRPRGGHYQSEVLKVREQLNALDAEMTRIENAPVDKTSFRSDAIAEIEKIAAAGAPRVNISARHGAPLGLGSRLALTLMGGDLVGDGGASFFVWLCKDLIIERLDAMIDTADFTGALSADEQEVAQADILAQRLKLERQEEALIDAAAEIEQFIPRRPDADPRAILMVSEL